MKPGTTPRPAAVLVPLVGRGGSVQVVLTRRTDALRHHGGQVSFPGGGIESRDNGPFAAALREAQEEIGPVHAAVSPLGLLDPFLPLSAFSLFPVAFGMTSGRV